MLLEVMQNVGDIFSAEEIALNAQEDLAKSSKAFCQVRAVPTG